MKHALLALLTTFIVYLLLGFYYLSLDPNKWSELGRMGFVMIAPLLSIFTFMVSKESENE